LSPFKKERSRQRAVGLKHRVLEPQPFALVDIRDRDALEGIAEPVNDLTCPVPDNHDHLVAPPVDRRLEDVREEGLPGDLDESFRSVVDQLAESTTAPGGGDDRVHTRDATRRSPNPIDGAIASRDFP
jgi:hypothetical protein